MNKYAATLFVLIIFAGCSQQQTVPTASQTTPQQQTAAVTAQAQQTINISNYAFNPATITVKSGTTVTWTNSDPVAHKVVSDSPAFTSDDIPQGGSYSFTFSTAGSYPYHCQIHPSMTGTVVVSP